MVSGKVGVLGPSVPGLVKQKMVEELKLGIESVNPGGGDCHCHCGNR